MNLASYTLHNFVTDFKIRFNMSSYFSLSIYQQFFVTGKCDLSLLAQWEGKAEIQQEVESQLNSQLMEPTQYQIQNETKKFLLPFPKELGSKKEQEAPNFLETESVLIPMGDYKTLCISSQIGCQRGCRFCETARMGLIRNLTASEMVHQAMTARFVLNEKVDNLVFMGMGEPLDNLPEVWKTVKILSEQQGFNLPRSNMTISTVGHVEGIYKLAELIRKDDSPSKSKVNLAVSLNAPNDDLRKQLMPISLDYSMDEIKQAIIDFPLRKKRDKILIGYIMIENVNDQPEHALELTEYLKSLPVMVNLIPFNPIPKLGYNRSSESSIDRFWQIMRNAGIECRVRGTKGDDIMAACGQLGNRKIRRQLLEDIKKD